MPTNQPTRRRPTVWESLIPVALLIGLLSLSVYFLVMIPRQEPIK